MRAFSYARVRQKALQPPVYIVQYIQANFRRCANHAEQVNPAQICIAQKPANLV